MRLILRLLALVSALIAAPAAAQADDIAAAERSVVRVVTVAIVNGQVVGFGHGSGVAIAPNRILTNAHVVGDAAQYPDNVVIGVVPSEGRRSYPGRLVALDRARDLALVELREGELPAASLFTGRINQRETVFALGYPGNVDLATAQSARDFIRPRTPVASDGIVSSLDTINGVTAVVHDADIARGNSGGPLVDRCGRVVGINTFISRADDGDSPFSFAVSMAEVTRFLQQAGQRFDSSSGACITQAEQRANAAAASAAAERAREQAAMARERSNAAQLEEQRAKVAGWRDVALALAALLLAGAVFAGNAAMLYQLQAMRQRQRAATMAAIALLAGAVLLFLLRPDPRNVILPTVTDTPTAPASTAPTAAQPAPGD